MANRALKKGRFTITRADSDDKIDLTISTSTGSAQVQPNLTYDFKRDVRRHRTTTDGYSDPISLRFFNHKVPSERNLLDLLTTEPAVRTKKSSKNAGVSSDREKDIEMLGMMEGHMCRMVRFIQFKDMLNIHRDLMIQILHKDKSNSGVCDTMFRMLEELSRQNLLLKLENKQLMNSLGI